MKDCAFCDIVTNKAPAHIVYEDKDTLAFLDKYPQTRGHLQFIPKIHYHWIYDIPDMGAFFDSAQNIIRGIIPVLGADHVTIATFGHQIEHAHLWIVPQYGQTTIVEGKGIIPKKDDMLKLAATLKSNLMKEVRN